MIITTSKHAFFYTEWPSNFWKTKFIWSAFGETHEFFCTEQAFMWAKAKFFKDEESAKAILDVSNHNRDPMSCKTIGRNVKNYIDAEWDKVRYKYMLEPNLERFRQDESLKSKLLDPKFDNLEFVEASPYDGIWGIKMGMKEPIDELDDENLWMGKNLLGKVITEVRNTLKTEIANA